MTTTLNWQPTHLENDLVKLVPLRESDVDNLFEVAADPLIWEQHPTKDRYKKEVFQLFFDGAIASKAAFLIIDKATDKLIGSTRYYDYKPEQSSIAVGYTFLNRSYWGTAYNKTSKKILLDYAFQYVDQVYFHIGANNIRSQKAILTIGATKVTEVDFDYYGQKVLHYEYVILKKDWIK
ncbi:GNAT family N-acetyltransferase [Cytophaga aurantiaca]|uniref:GNAT family N-acetyltransferase n=1 Tax=Cytophaga aurantiaca TaxID=29530 RepID=UPI00035DBDA7|nr:GNAT family N-acetyltransferase [Cytophaga aurantiaca]